MAVLSKLTMKLTAEGGQQVKTELQKVDQQLEKTAQTSGKAFDADKLSKWGKALASSVAAIGSASVLLSQMGQLSQKIIDIGNASITLGLTTEQLSLMEFQSRRVGVSLDDLVTAISDLNERAKSGSNDYATEFEKIGVSMENIAKLSAGEIFQKFAEGIRNTSDASVTAAVGSELLGDNYQRLFPFIRLTTDELAELTRKAQESNQIISGQSVESAKNLQESVNDLKDSWDGLLKSFADGGGFQAVSGWLDDLNSKLTGTVDLLNNAYQAAGGKGSTDTQSAVKFGSRYGAGLLGLGIWASGIDSPFDDPNAIKALASTSPVFTPASKSQENQAFVSALTQLAAGPLGRAFGDSGVPWDPDMPSRADSLGYLDGISDDQGWEAIKEALVEQTDVLKDSLEGVASLPESQMWSNIIDDLRAGNAILQNIDGTLRIIQRKESVQIKRVS